MGMSRGKRKKKKKKKKKKKFGGTGGKDRIQIADTKLKLSD